VPAIALQQTLTGNEFSSQLKAECESASSSSCRLERSRFQSVIDGLFVGGKALAGVVVDDGGVPAPGSARSVKIGSDERTGWSSERPRNDGAPPRPVDVSGRCHVLAPAARLRYSPGSLLLIVSADPQESARFAERVLEERGVVLSLAKVRQLLAGKIKEDEVEDRAGEILAGAVEKRLRANETVVLVLEGLDAATRESFLRMAHAVRRPRHLILLETPREQVPEELRAPLNELRRSLDAGELGAEGIQTALRLGGSTQAELKRIVFQPPPRED
jgi:hypothetical protein